MSAEDEADGKRDLHPAKFTIADWERWLDKVLELLSDDRVDRAFWPASERGRVLRRVVEIVYSFSSQNEETYAETEDRLADASRLLLGLLSVATRPTRDLSTIAEIADAAQLHHHLFDHWLERNIWNHRDDLLYEFTNKGYRGEEDFAFRARCVSSFAADLIERPWLDSRYVEWVIIDWLVCNRVREFGATILAGRMEP
jgi:hypothetical protein